VSKKQTERAVGKKSKNPNEVLHLAPIERDKKLEMVKKMHAENVRKLKES
jgi:hypothetical protein